MKCWVARSASKTHIRIQLEPFTHTWHGWDLRESTISQKDLQYLETAFGPDAAVDLERIHNEVWLRSFQPGRGRAVAHGLLPAESPQSLA